MAVTGSRPPGCGSRPRPSYHYRLDCRKSAVAPTLKRGDIVILLVHNNAVAAAALEMRGAFRSTARPPRDRDGLLGAQSTLVERRGADFVSSLGRAG